MLPALLFLFVIWRSGIKDLVQEWVYRNRYPAEHTRTNSAAGDGPHVTLIGRDEDGRITGLARAGTVTRCGYDGAGQLVAAATTPLGNWRCGNRPGADSGLGVRCRR